MDNNEKEPEKITENLETEIKHSSNIEPIETIQSSFKGSSNYDKRKTFHQNYQKQNHHLNYNNNHQYYPNSFANQNTMSKKRKGSVQTYNDKRL